MNACKSGIHAKSEIIPGEDPAELQQLTAEYYESIEPQGREEAVLVDQVISADWQLRRLRHAEAGIFTHFIELGNRQPDQTSTGWAYSKNQDSLDRCYRNQAAIARTLRASLDSLLRLRKEGLLQRTEQNEPNLPSPGPEPVALPAPAADADPALLDETNPISEVPAPSPEPEIDETNPISEVPAPSPQSLVPAERRQPPAPVVRPRYRYYNGQRVPITDIRNS